MPTTSCKVRVFGVYSPLAGARAPLLSSPRSATVQSRQGDGKRLGEGLSVDARGGRRCVRRLWTTLADRLQEELSAGTYTAWFSDATAHRHGRRHPRGDRPRRVRAELDRGPLRPVDRARRARRRRGPARRPDPRGRRGGGARRPTSSGPGRAARRPCAAAPPVRRARPHAQPALHVRRLRDRLVEPVRARGGAGRRRVAGPGLQPARDLRIDGPGENAPPAGDRPLRPRGGALAADALRHERVVHERLHRRFAGTTPRAVQEPLPRRTTCS